MWAEPGSYPARIAQSLADSRPYLLVYKLINFLRDKEEQVAKRDSIDLIKQQKKEQGSLYKEVLFSRNWWKKQLLNEEELDLNDAGGC